MGDITYAFAENKPTVLTTVGKNARLQGRVYQLQQHAYWQVPKEGMLFLDIDRYALPAKKYHQYMKRTYLPITDDGIRISSNTAEDIHKLKCYVGCLPDNILVSYLKDLARNTHSKLGIVMLHERGDTLYDTWSWLFDYSQEQPVEQFHAVYEGNQQPYQFFEMEGCPFRIVRKTAGNFSYPSPMQKLSTFMGINKFPDLIEIGYTGNGFENEYKKALLPFLVH